MHANKFLFPGCFLSLLMTQKAKAFFMLSIVKNIGEREGMGMGCDMK